MEPIIIPSLVKILLIAGASFLFGSLLGFMTRKILKVVFSLVLIFLVVFSADISGYINTGIEWTKFFNRVLEMSGSKQLITQFFVALFGAFKSASQPGAQKGTLELSFIGPLSNIFFIAIIALPFLIGFFKSLYPQSSE